VPTAHGLIKDRDRNLVVVIVVEDDEVLNHDLMPLAESPPPAARYGVPVRSKRSSTVHKTVAPPCTLSTTWFVLKSTTSTNLRGSLMESGSAP
jgi:hypothetical protein